MANTNIAFDDRVRYTLSNRYMGDSVIVEPIGWTTDEKEYQRHKDYGGMFPQFSNSLKFIQDGKDYINTVRKLYGINEEIRLKREERNTKTDIWQLTYTGFLDLSTWEFENDQVSVKFNSGGLEQSLKTRDSDTFEIDREKTADGIILDPLIPIDIQLDGRNINLISQFIVKPENNSVRLENSTSDGNTRGSTIAVPLYLNSKSHENAQSPLEGTLWEDNSFPRTENGTNGNMFFAVSDRDRTFRLTLEISFTVNITFYDDVDNFSFYCRIGQYKDGVDYIYETNRFLLIRENYNEVQNKRFTVAFDEVITITQGDSLALVFDQNYDGKGAHDSRLNIEVNQIEGYLKIDENSFYDKSTTKGVLLYELFDRLVSICTNKKNAFKSDLLGRTDIGYSEDGEWSLVACSHGFWIRQFKKSDVTMTTDQDKNLFKPLTTSFKEAYDSANAVFNIGLGVEQEGNREFVRLEKLSYFYNRNVLVRLPNQVKNVKRKESSEYNYSSLEFGYEKGGDYQEAMGLDEPNAKSNFTTFINRVKNIYSKVSKYRADSYGQEFARRKSVELFATEDTPYDDDIFFNDLKRGPGSVFLQRKWDDDFEKLPTGIFSPETATNLRFSPVNNMLRHGWWFTCCLQRYLSEFVRYSSSTLNSKLRTKLKIGKPEYAENGDIVNAEFEKARFLTEEIEFDHICDFDVMQQINGYTNIQGKMVRNVYGLIEFINEFNEVERGYLTNLKPNSAGKWTLIKFNNQ